MGVLGVAIRGKRIVSAEPSHRRGGGGGSDVRACKGEAFKAVGSHE
jgi:hypothetical protein